MKVSIEPLKPSELPRMVTGLRLIDKTYPICQTKVEESGDTASWGVHTFGTLQIVERGSVSPTGIVSDACSRKIEGGYLNTNTARSFSVHFIRQPRFACVGVYGGSNKTGAVIG